MCPMQPFGHLQPNVDRLGAATDGVMCNSSIQSKYKLRYGISMLPAGSSLRVSCLMLASSLSVNMSKK